MRVRVQRFRLISPTFAQVKSVTRNRYYMHSIKRLFLFAAFAAAFVLSSCSDSDNAADSHEAFVPTLSGTVASVDDYGQLVATFTPAEMAKAGFEYSDLVNVTLSDTLCFKKVPFVTSFNEVGAFNPIIVDYNARGTSCAFGVVNGNFHAEVGGAIGDRFTVTLAERGGYKETYELMKSVYPTERRAGETAEQYANFREVVTTGISRGVLYRSSNPLNNSKNPGRYVVADSLTRAAGVKTEIDLSDTPERVAQCIASEGYAATYCPQLYREGKAVTCGMDASPFGTAFKAGMAKAARFMISNEPPYLVHCNEGKERCGFVCMLFEAFMGASVDEMRRDYMVTMLNFYRIPDGGESYNLRQRMSVDRLIWMMSNESARDYGYNIDWDNIDVYTGGGGLSESDRKWEAVSPRAAAIKYLTGCGLTEEEINALAGRLGGIDKNAER